MPPKLPLRRPHLDKKELPEIAAKPSWMSRAGVFASFSFSDDEEEKDDDDDDDHDISSPAPVVERSPTRTTAREEEEAPTPVAPGWAHAGPQVPTMDSYAPGPSVSAPALFPGSSNFSSMPLGPGAASESFDRVFWNQALEYDPMLAYEQFDMQASNIVNGAANEIQQLSSEPPLISTSRPHQVPVDGLRPEQMRFWQIATHGYRSACPQPCPTHTFPAIGQNSPYARLLLADIDPVIGSAPPAMSQPRAGTWNTGSSGNMWEAPMSFAQQASTSAAMPVNNQVVNYYGSDIAGPSNNHLPAPTPLMHRQELQQSPVVTGFEPPGSLAYERSRKRRLDVISM
ncbi:hypothetical protein KCU85_g9053, partial [Aureobasidium melanogenum]